MSRDRVLILTSLAMIAFAGNSLICRLALERTSIDPASFTLIRVLSGAIVLWMIMRSRGGRPRDHGDWVSGFFLFAYAAGFSFAYVSLPTAVGALILFGSVQATMIGYGVMSGERLSVLQVVGLIPAMGGLVYLLLPGLSSPSIQGSVLMLIAGIAWGGYSLRGRGVENPTFATAGNFLRSSPFAAVLAMGAIPWMNLDGWGAAYAVMSGAVTSGMGYVIWYTAIRGLNASLAAVVQLSVPVIAAIGGVVCLGEDVTLRLVGCSLAILGGIALVIAGKRS